MATKHRIKIKLAEIKRLVTRIEATPFYLEGLDARLHDMIGELTLINATGIEVGK